MPRHTVRRGREARAPHLTVGTSSKAGRQRLDRRAPRTDWPNRSEDGRRRQDGRRVGTGKGRGARVPVCSLQRRGVRLCPPASQHSRRAVDTVPAAVQQAHDGALLHRVGARACSGALRSRGGLPPEPGRELRHLLQPHPRALRGGRHARRVHARRGPPTMSAAANKGTKMIKIKFRKKTAFFAQLARARVVPPQRRDGGR